MIPFFCLLSEVTDIYLHVIKSSFLTFGNSSKYSCINSLECSATSSQTFLPENKDSKITQAQYLKVNLKHRKNKPLDPEDIHENM